MTIPPPPSHAPTSGAPTHNKGPKSSQWGGAALEYILVSTFAAVVTMAALAFIGHAFKEHLGRMADKLGVDSEIDLGDDFDLGH